MLTKHRSPPPLVALAALCAALLALAACRPDRLNLSPAYLAPSRSEIDFGTVKIGDEATEALYLFNRGQQPIDLDAPTGDFKAGVFQLLPSAMQVTAGTDTYIAVIFEPQAIADYETIITFPNNSQNLPAFQLWLRGTGISADPCYGITCQTPPNDCYYPNGECVDGACYYPLKGDVPCQSPPPPNACFKGIGRCLAGACIYDVQNGVACNDGDACTLLDACTDGQCIGARKDCPAVPPDTCITGSLLRRYDPIGYCDAQGACQYPHTDITCEFGCYAGQCQGDPCAGGCDDGNPCTLDSCGASGQGCVHADASGADCIVSWSEACPIGRCVGTSCRPVTDVTCVAEWQYDLCMEIEVPGLCTASGQCVVQEVPPEYQCDGCTDGICVQCYGIKLCLTF